MKKAIIWCFERGMWWNANSNGYVDDYYSAGVYTLEEATAIVEQANIMVKDGQMPNEILFEVEVDQFGKPSDIDMLEFFKMIIDITTGSKKFKQPE